MKFTLKLVVCGLVPDQAGARTATRAVQDAHLAYDALLAGLAGLPFEPLSLGVVTPSAFAHGIAPYVDRRDIGGVIVLPAAGVPAKLVTALLQVAVKPAVVLFDGDGPRDTTELHAQLRARRMAVDVIDGPFDDPAARDALAAWVGALQAIGRLRQASVGILCQPAHGVPGAVKHLPLLSDHLGVRFEELDSDALVRRRGDISRYRLQKKRDELERAFEIDASCAAADVDAVLRTACALDDILWASRCGSMVYCPGPQAAGAHEQVDRTIHAGAALLNGAGVSVAADSDVVALVARRLLEALAAPSASVKLAGLSFDRESSLWNLADVPNRALAKARRGRLSGGTGQLALTMPLEPGPVTVLSLVEPAPGVLALQFAEGWAVDTHGRSQAHDYELLFKGPMGDFAHHWQAAGGGTRCALGLGHRGADLKRVAGFLRLGVMEVG